MGSVVKVEFVKGLNPYSTGIWSATLTKIISSCQQTICLNPYSTGIWSATNKKKMNKEALEVLILILLEYGLQHTSYWRKKAIEAMS